MEKEPKWSEDGKCPYCDSSEVKRLGGYGAGATRGPGLPSIESRTYLCLNHKCKKKFRFIK